MKWKLVKGSANAALVAKYPAEDVPPNGVLETLVMECLKTKVKSQALVQIFSPDPIRISPSVAVLGQEKAGADFEANLILTLTSNSTVGADSIAVSAYVNDKPCRVSVKPLGKKSLRLKVNVPADLALEMERLQNESAETYRCQLKFDVGGSAIPMAVVFR